MLRRAAGDPGFLRPPGGLGGLVPGGGRRITLLGWAEPEIGHLEMSAVMGRGGVLVRRPGLLGRGRVEFGPDARVVWKVPESLPSFGPGRQEMKVLLATTTLRKTSHADLVGNEVGGGLFGVG